MLLRLTPESVTVDKNLEGSFILSLFQSQGVLCHLVLVLMAKLNFLRNSICWSDALLHHSPRYRLLSCWARSEHTRSTRSLPGFSHHPLRVE